MMRNQDNIAWLHGHKQPEVHRLIHIAQIFQLLSGHVPIKPIKYQGFYQEYLHPDLLEQISSAKIFDL